MSKAACPSSKLTRRAAIAATLAGAAVPASAAALPGSDQVLAMIAAHKAAYAECDRMCGVMADLERAIPVERRQEWMPEDGPCPGDDPRWTAMLIDYHATFEAEEKAAWALAHARPTTLAAAAALMRYAYEYTAQGCDWPDAPEQDGDEEADAYWHATFHRSLAAALEAMTS